MVQPPRLLRTGATPALRVVSLQILAKSAQNFFQRSSRTLRLHSDTDCPQRLSAKLPQANFDQILVGADDRGHVIQPVDPLSDSQQIFGLIGMVIGKLLKRDDVAATRGERVTESQRIADAAKTVESLT